MNADDDGFCEHFALMRMTDSKPDDLKILQAKGFVSVFDDKVLIIMDWKENNYLRNDRYTPSKYLGIYKEELGRLSSGIPTVDKVATQVRIGKDRIGKDSIEHTDDPSDQEKGFEYNPLFVEFWTAYPKKTGKGFAHTAWNKIKPKVSRETADRIIASVKAHSQTDQWKKENGQYIPNPATFLNQRRWEDEVSEHGPQSANHDPKYGNLDVKQV